MAPATKSTPDVSLVCETSNDREERRIRFSDVVQAWKRQTRADRILEWIVIASREPSAEETRLLADLPLRWLQQGELTYYQQKNAGLAASRGAYVAFADSDALPADTWLERALETIEAADERVALVTGRSRYLPGPFSREMAVAQMPPQSDRACDTSHFLAHNALLRMRIVRSLDVFCGDAIRVGSDTDLAARLLDAGYRLRYDPSLQATHHYSGRLRDLYRTSALTGYAFGQFQKHQGRTPSQGLWDFAGRLRVLVARWWDARRSLGMSLWRLPLSVAFFVAYSAAVAHGLGLSVRGSPKPFRRG